MPAILHCLAHCEPSDELSLLFGAAGSSIHTFDLRNGRHIGSWPAENTSQSKVSDAELRSNGQSVAAGDDTGSPPPSKRAKLSSEISAASSTEIITDEPEKMPEQAPTVVRLAVSRDAKHLIAVTGEDKCIRVFEISPMGQLCQVSERIMPKRPCALDITHDNATILSADKFGDVYALPLLGKPFEIQNDNFKQSDSPGIVEVEKKADVFVSKANALTVHTKRNRDVLLQQQKIKAKKPIIKDITFEHQLILGHVSLLTELLCISIPSSHGPPREYILTCDRDEHIRVSRGHPQAHVIEGYCLGHTSFVSKLCILPSQPELLISGGGDDDLLLWHWPTNSIRQRINLREIINSIGEVIAPKGTHVEAIAINKILYVPATHGVADEVFVSIERMPAIFRFQSAEKGRLMYIRHLETAGNVIDMSLLHFKGAVLVSLDGDEDVLSAYSPAHQGEHSQEDSATSIQSSIRNINDFWNNTKHSQINDLYPLQNLRKRGNGEDE